MSNDDPRDTPPPPGPSDGSGFPPAPTYDDPGAGRPLSDPGAPPPPPPPGSGAPPPPPGYGQTPPPPPPGYGSDPSGAGPAPSYGTPPGYGGTGDGGMVKGPRPKVLVGGILVAAGAVLTILGVFLPWASGGGESVNGLDDFIFTSDGELYLAESPGTIPLVFAVIMLAFGITLVWAGRVLAVAIIAIVGAVIAELIGLGMISIASGLVDDVSEADLGVGAILQPIAPLLSLAGAITATAKRRRMVPAHSVGAGPYG